MSLDSKIDSSANTLFAGRYHLERQLGKGGMGAVHLALDRMLGGEAVALKILHSELNQNDKHTKRFLREVQLTRKVTHPNVVRTFDVGEYAGQLFFTMEYVDGQTLKEKLRSGRCGADESSRIIREVCKGLYAIHQANIIHRDLKPGNIVITPEGFVKIADFGIAKPGVSDLTGHHEVVGSIPYMAPEIWLGKDVGPAADIYALGVVAYEMLTGVLPFEGDSPAELMCKHLEAVPLSPINLQHDIPEWLSSLVMRMLEKVAAARPVNVSEIVRIINHNLDDAEPEAIDRTPQLDHSIPESKPIVKEANLSSLDVLLEQPASLDEVYNTTEHYLKGAPILAIPKIEAPEVEAPDPFRTSNVGHGLKASLQIVLLLVLLALVVPTASSTISELWSKAAGSESTLQVLFCLLLAVVFHSLILSVPFYMLCIVNRSAVVAFKGWLKVTFVLATLISIASFVNLLRLEYKSYTLNIGYDKGRIVSAAAATLVNVTEAALLVPQGAVFDIAIKFGYPVLIKNEKTQSHQYWEYFAIVLGCWLCIFRLAERWIYRRVKRRIRFLLASTILAVALPLALEALLFNVFSEQLSVYSIEYAAFNFAGVYHSVSEFNLACIILNWLILLAMMQYVFPWILRRVKQAEDAI